MKQIDARGLSCPQPVILARKAISTIGEESVVVLVDSITSRDNVMRAARMDGCVTEVSANDSDISITIRKK